ncbi:MAG: HD domain-containing protein [Acidimicrobiales bacterium]|jgi:predicted hydrolase (HD superfamily)
MPISTADADALVADWVTDPSLRAHLAAVSTVMRSAALTYGGTDADPEAWALAGLLHDADWQLDPDHHPDRIVAWLRQRGEDDVAEAVATHSTAWGTPATLMGSCLLAFDELTGFVVAVGKVNPEGIRGVTVPGVLKKLKRPSFAVSVDRSEVAAGAAILGIGLEDAVGFVLSVLGKG